MVDYKIILLLTEKQNEIITDFIDKSVLTKRTIVEMAIMQFIDNPYINVLAQIDKRVNNTDERKTKRLNIVMSENHHKMILQYIERTKDDSKSRVKKMAIGKVVLSALLNYISINAEMHEIDRISDIEEQIRVKMMKLGQVKKEYSEYKYELGKNNKDISFTEHEYIKCQLGLNDGETRELTELYQNTVSIIKDKYMQGIISLETLKMVSGLKKTDQVAIVNEINKRSYKISNKTIQRIMKELNISRNADVDIKQKTGCIICNNIVDIKITIAIKEKRICKKCASMISKKYIEKYT